MKVKTLMNSNVIKINLDTPIRKVKEIFEEMGFHHLLVVEKNKLLGVISDRDLLKALSPNIDSLSATDKDLATLNKRAHQIMTRKPICLSIDATASDAIKLFDENNISCIPVVDGEKPVGIVSWRDIFKVIIKRIEQHQQ
jgi:acetoin utilization protein AcuB